MTCVNEEIEEPPTFGAGIRTGYMRGLAKTKGTVKILLDIDCVMIGSERQALVA